MLYRNTTDLVETSFAQPAGRLCERIGLPPLLHGDNIEQRRQRYTSWVRRLALPETILSDSIVLTEDESQVRSLARFLRKLDGRGLRAPRIAFLGGSLTFGHGVNRPEDTWPEQFRRALLEIWHTPSLFVHNGALPATSAGFAALCFETLMPLRPDLLVIEYSFNTVKEQSFELLLETARQSDAALLVVDYWPQHEINSLGRCIKALQSPPLGSEERMPSCPGLYDMSTSPFTPSSTRFFPLLLESGVPVVSYRAFGPWLVKLPPTTFVRYVAADRRHLSAEGYSLLAATAVHFLWRASLRLAGRGGEIKPFESCAGVTRQSQSAAVTWRRQTAARAATCTIGSQLQEYVLPANNNSAECSWQYAIERGKPGLITTTVGCRLQLMLPDLERRNPSDRRGGGRSAGDSGESSGDIGDASADEDSPSPPYTPVHVHSVLAHLVYLQSYEHMGAARISCDAGCSCQPLVIDAHNTDRLDSFELVAPPLQLNVSAASNCVLGAEVLSRTNSGEHKFKITALIVTQASGNAPSAVGEVGLFVDYSSTNTVMGVANNTQHRHPDRKARGRAVAGALLPDYGFSGLANYVNM